MINRYLKLPVDYVLTVRNEIKGVVPLLDIKCF